MTKKSNRSCGDCTVCCTVLSVPEISKPQNTPCLSQGSRGCKIYELRPESCRTFSCLWIQGFGEACLRPDLSGVLIYGHETKLGPSLIVTELWSGALEKMKGRTALKEAKRLNIGLYVRHANGHLTLEGDEKFIEEASQIIKGLTQEQSSRIRLKIIY